MPASVSELLRQGLRDYAGRIAVVSSFGAESAVLLGFVAELDPAVPVLFLDTGQHFPETLAYRRELVATLGLTDIRDVSPRAGAVAARDPEGMLHAFDGEACCALRKIEPLEQALAPFSAWVTGRKRAQSATRAHMPFVERVDGRIKINPLAEAPATLQRPTIFGDRGDWFLARRRSFAELWPSPRRHPRAAKYVKCNLTLYFAPSQNLARHAPVARLHRFIGKRPSWRKLDVPNGSVERLAFVRPIDRVLRHPPLATHRRPWDRGDESRRGVRARFLAGPGRPLPSLRHRARLSPGLSSRSARQALLAELRIGCGIRDVTP
jgi:hypothetical protein